jgi:hypothetical protein
MFTLANVFRKARPGAPWPLRFDSFSFGLRCYNTLKCNVIFDNREHSVFLTESSGPPYAENWRDSWTGSYGSTEEFETRGFSSPVDIRWTALERTELLWERRIAVLATFHYIKRGVNAPTLRVAERLLGDRHDLIHKAVGWMLREVGQRDPAMAQTFLRKHYRSMPRTMLRYAIERFPEPLRQQYLKGQV